MDKALRMCTKKGKRQFHMWMQGIECSAGWRTGYWRSRSVCTRLTARVLDRFSRTAKLIIGEPFTYLRQLVRSPLHFELRSFVGGLCSIAFKALVQCRLSCMRRCIGWQAALKCRIVVRLRDRSAFRTLIRKSRKCSAKIVVRTMRVCRTDRFRRLRATCFESLLEVLSHGENLAKVCCICTAGLMRDTRWLWQRFLSRHWIFRRGQADSRRRCRACRNLLHPLLHPCTVATSRLIAQARRRSLWRTRRQSVRRIGNNGSDCCCRRCNRSDRRRNPAHISSNTAHTTGHDHTPKKFA